MHLPHSLDTDYTLLEGGLLRHYRFSRVGSTQKVAFDLARADEAKEFCVSADQQVAGRGRTGRAWHSPEGSLSLSIVLQNHDDPQRTLPYIVGLGVYDALIALQVTESALKLKWPNDLLLSGAKCAGILIEHYPQPRAMSIVGIGMNIAQDPTDAPYAVTNLQAHGVQVSPIDLAEEIVRSVLQWRDRALMVGTKELYRLWQAKSYVLGTVMRTKDAQGSIEGKFLGLHSDGALRLELPSGEEHLVYSADCIVQEQNA